MRSVAPRFPTMRYTAMDYAFVPPIENVEGVLFRDDQVGYLAGVAARAFGLAADVRGQLLDAAPNI